MTVEKLRKNEFVFSVEDFVSITFLNKHTKNEHHLWPSIFYWLHFEKQTRLNVVITHIRPIDFSADDCLFFIRCAPYSCKNCCRFLIWNSRPIFTRSPIHTFSCEYFITFCHCAFAFDIHIHLFVMSCFCIFHWLLLEILEDNYYRFEFCLFVPVHFVIT